MTETITYEIPTDELRQVRHTEWVQDHLLCYYTIQRKWKSYAAYPQGAVSSQCCAEEWRDLPTVTAEEATNKSTTE